MGVRCSQGPAQVRGAVPCANTQSCHHPLTNSSSIPPHTHTHIRAHTHIHTHIRAHALSPSQVIPVSKVSQNYSPDSSYTACLHEVSGLFLLVPRFATLPRFATHHCVPMMCQRRGRHVLPLAAQQHVLPLAVYVSLLTHLHLLSVRSTRLLGYALPTRSTRSARRSLWETQTFASEICGPPPLARTLSRSHRRFTPIFFTCTVSLLCVPLLMSSPPFRFALIPSRCRVFSSKLFLALVRSPVPLSRPLISRPSTGSRSSLERADEPYPHRLVPPDLTRMWHFRMGCRNTSLGHSARGASSPARWIKADAMSSTLWAGYGFLPRSCSWPSPIRSSRAGLGAYSIVRVLVLRLLAGWVG